jgi:photosystem II stability/assembly factor-like uncharacterized protein
MRSALVLLALVGAVAVSAQSSWQTIASNVATAATGIWFSTDSVGFLPADENGAGAEILKSTDGGKTWATNEPHQGGFMFLDVAGYSNVVVVAGVFGEEFSDDSGAHFNTSIGGGQGQCVRAIGDHSNPDGIGVAGEFGLISPKNGVAVSFDGGISFTAHDAGLKTDSRYAAFVNSDVWYVTAGEWPDEGNDDDNSPSNDDNPFNDDDMPSEYEHYLTARFSVRSDRQGRMRPHLKAPRVTSLRGALSGSNTTYMAQVTMTTDGGKTWNTVFEQDGSYYPNGIACTSSAQCCFVAEADSGADAGSRIFCTYDNGAKWNQTLFNAGPTNSLMDITAVSNTEYWAAGGQIGGATLAAEFWHSTDAGQTWTKEASLDGNYATSIDCPDAQHCWATTVDTFQQSSIAAYGQ